MIHGENSGVGEGMYGEGDSREDLKKDIKMSAGRRKGRQTAGGGHGGDCEKGTRWREWE